MSTIRSMLSSLSGRSEPTSHRRAAIAALGVLLLGFAVFAGLYVRFPVLYDTDSYYHLAIARAYAENGILDTLPWARLSLLSDGFGDKEFLFHVVLAPFSRTADPSLGGRLALALLNALVAAILAYLGVRAVGAWGLLVPAWVFLGSLDFSFRMIRLRPEILSLILFLVAAWLASHRRYRLLGVTALVYTLSYTAFHAMWGLCLAWFVTQAWITRERDWGLLVYPSAGVGLGLILHPHFPHNLTVWIVQNVELFRRGDLSDLGREILPQTADNLVLLNLTWWALAWVLWRSTAREPPAAESADSGDAALIFGVGAAVFGVLYLWMVRFCLYFIPFASLALLFEIRRRGWRLHGATALPWRGRLPALVTILLAFLIGVPRGWELVGNLGSASGRQREQEWAAFAAAVPKGAKVAAEWGSSQIYMFWAPQASYLNVLNPIFMAQPYPDAYRAERALFESREPDVPLTLRAALDSDYLALSRFHPTQELLRRLSDDPRLSVLYLGWTLLYATVEDNEGFILDWRVASPELPVPPPADATPSQWPRYPRLEEPALASIEGFVDAARVRATECTVLVHEMEEGEARSLVLELAPWGPTRVWLGDRPIVHVRGSLRAILADAIRLPLELAAGTHRLTVETCPAAPDGRSGFYLRPRV